jgi:hypothetical protein
VKAGDWIQLSKTEERHRTTLGLYAIDGRLIQQWNYWSEKLQINSELKPGTYILQTTGNGPRAAANLVVF